MVNHEMNTIHQAIEECKASSLAGWELVAFAQKLVANHMQYSYFNSFDLPAQAFEKGQGYCWQQAGALDRILKGLGFDSRLVHAFQNRFPDVERDGVTVHIGVSGHVWCRVKIGNEEKDVCPGNPANSPGNLHFVPLSKVKDFKGLIWLPSYLGSALLNHQRGKKFMEQKSKLESLHNPDKCPCKKVKCPRYKKCEECKANHYGKGGWPSCERK